MFIVTDLQNQLNNEKYFLLAYNGLCSSSTLLIGSNIFNYY